MKESYFQNELEWLLEGLIGDNLCCKLILETVFISIPLNVKKLWVMIEICLAKKIFYFPASTDSQYNWNVCPAVLKIYMLKIIKIL